MPGRQKKDAEGLTPKEAAFVREYVLDHDGAAAIRRTGYTGPHAGKYACDMRRRPHVQAAINRRDAAREAEVKQIAWGKTDVVRRLQQVVRKAMQGERWGEATRALELLGKELGMFKDRKDVTLRLPKPPHEMTDEELEAVFAKLGIA